MTQTKYLSIYFSIFRVFICFHIIKDIFYNFSFFYVLIGPGKFSYYRSKFISINTYELLTDNYEYVVISICIMSLLWGFGIGKRITGLSTAILLVILQEMNPYVLNGGDNLLRFLVFYCCIPNTYSYLSINKSEQNKQSAWLLHLSYLLIICHLSIVYFISGINKIHSDPWFYGYALSDISQINRFRFNDISFTLMNNKYISIFICYIVMIWETLFPLTLQNIYLRVATFIIGITMHLSIYFMMMIDDFSILFISCYGFILRGSDINIISKYANNLKTAVNSRRVTRPA